MLFGYPNILKVLKVGGSGTIRQLIISPEKDYLAVVRSHTIWVTALPDSTFLGNPELGPLKPKSFQLGPVCHVLDQSPLVSVLWHPLGELGRCLVTVTSDAVVRLWEINREDRASFSEPSLSIDLTKLANATSADQDLNASKYGSGKAYSPDSAELEPGAACFGGHAEAGEYPWRSMTLWIATKDAELYALCPLLPKRWQARTGLVESLSAVTEANSIEALDNLSSNLLSDAQAQFVVEIEDQQPLTAPNASEFDPARIFSRPQFPGSVPKLQGPFSLEPEIDEDVDIVDLLVVGLGTNEDEEDASETPASVICLASSVGTVYICLDLEGVQGQWLPLRSSLNAFSTPKKFTMLEDHYRPIFVLETIDLAPPSTDVSPTFTLDACSPHAFFVTTSAGVDYLSLTSWIRRIQRELDDPAESGAAFRMGLALESSQVLIERPIDFNKILMVPAEDRASFWKEAQIRSSVVFADSSRISSLGYMVLTSVNGQPYVAQLDIADHDLYLMADDSELERAGSPTKAIMLHESREAYRPDPTFGLPTKLPQMRDKIPRQHKKLLDSEVRLSPAMLEILTEAHRILSKDAHRLNTAAADLFRQCERLQPDFKEQLRRAKDIKERIETITGDDQDIYEEGVLYGTERLNERIETVRTRQQAISNRLEALKKNMTKVSARELSDKEKAWIAEVQRLSKNVPEDAEARDEAPLLRRFADVTELSAELVAQGKKSDGEKGNDQQNAVKVSQVKVPEGFRKTKVKGVMVMLDRETALVEAAAERLHRLSIHT
jgi:nucleoporin NUP82